MINIVYDTSLKVPSV